MSLYKTTVSVPVTGGIDTKTTSKLVQGGFFLDLRNTVRRKTGALEKRFGFTALSNLDTAGTAITSGQRLDTFFDDLLLINNLNLYSYLSASNQWINRGAVVPKSVTSQSIIASTGISVMADADYLEGLECYAWEDSRNGGIKCSVLDRETGAYVIADTEVSATGTRPKVVAIGATFCITYIEGGNFRVRRITIGQPATLQTAQTIEAGITDYPYDIARWGSSAYAIFAYNTATQVRVGYLMSDGTVGSLAGDALADPIIINNLGQNAVNLVNDDVRNLIYVFFHNSAGTQADDLRCQVLSAPTLTAIDAVDVESSVTNVRNITGAVQASGIVTVYYERSAATVTTHLVRKNTIIRSAGVTTVGTAANFKRCVGLASKAFLVDDTIYVTIVRDSALQSTYFVTQSTGFTIARMQASTALGQTQSTAGVLRSGLPRVSSIDNERLIALSVRNRLDTLTTTAQSGNIGVNRQTITFNTSEFDTALLGRNLHIAGGVLLDYDGVRTVEHGFHTYPEVPTAVASNAAGTLTSSTTYRFKLVYEWVDAQGQRHQSAPSVAVSVVMGVADDTITITAPTLTITEKNNVRVVAYRTKAAETTVYYRDTDVANDATTDSVTITLLNPDTTIATKEILYTVGGTLDNIAPPACLVSHSHKFRLFLAGTEDGDVWYSRAQVKGEGVFFSDGLKIRLPDVTALETLDDKLVLFKERSIYTLVGDGPSDTGAQNDFVVPHRLPGDVGCTNQKSLISMPMGLMFKSANGIKLLTRSLEIVNVGDPVMDYDGLTISSAVLVKDKREVRFTTTDGVCLVYNYDFNEWSTFTNYMSISACIALDTYCHLTAEGVVNREVSGQFNDNGILYSMRIESNWFQFAKLQGFQRLYRWALIGDFVSHHITKVKLAYDYENYYTDPVYFNTETGMGTETYGAETYGIETPYGSSDSSVYQFRSKPAQQKCQAVKFLIEDLDSLSDAGGGSFKLVAFGFETGAKQGLLKMRESKTRGV